MLGSRIETLVEASSLTTAPPRSTEVSTKSSFPFVNESPLLLLQVLLKLVQDSRSPPEPTLIPSRGFLTPPGGQLVQTLVGHSASAVYGLAATSDGKYAVTGIYSVSSLGNFSV